MSVLDVRDVTERSRYEATVDGALVGYSDYRIDGDVIAFTHAQVEPAHGGHGIGSAMAQATLDDVRAGGSLRVRPVCSFYVWFIQRNPEYADLLAD